MKLTTRIAYTIFPPYVWDILREESRLTWCRWSARWRVLRRPIERLRDGRHQKIHLGCGARIMTGWVNVDGGRQRNIDLWWDLRERLPFEDASTFMIYSEHLLEHLFKEDAIKLLKECYRILEPAGIIRLGVPDAEIYLHAYIEGHGEFFKALEHLGGTVVPLSTPMDVINQMFRMGGVHHFAWDFLSLSTTLGSIGFINIKRWAAGQASCPEICLDDPAHAFETLYIEASRPGK